MMKSLSLRVLPVLLFSTLSSAYAAPAHDDLSSTALQGGIEKGLSFFEREQMSDGSWKTLIQVSSPMYNCQMIFLYEYLNRTEEKREVISGLIQHVWSHLGSDGGISGFKGGKSDLGVSTLAYMAARIAGESENTSRMKALAQFIRDGGGAHKAVLALPYLLLFNVSTEAHCIPVPVEKMLLDMEDKLPWAKVVLYPLLHMYVTGKMHSLSSEKFPKRIARFSLCPKGLPQPIRALRIGEKQFWKWMDDHLNTDGTLFDYTPTSIPALMALSQGGPKYSEILERGVKTLESFQQQKPTGIFQSPGEASVGETVGIVHSFMEMGLSPDHPMLIRAEKFIRQMQHEDTGAFGFSKQNRHFPDTDDTSNGIFVLKRLNQLRGTPDPELDRKLEKGLRWLISMQNRDGGFGTWEKDHFPELTSLMDRIKPNRGLVMAESVTEHTARIVVNLSLFKDEHPEFHAPYRKALRYLLSRQGKDGSYAGTWFVNYLFGTSMVMAALGTSSSDPEVQAAIEIGLKFILSHQQADGGFSESPQSFDDSKSIPLVQSSPAQTGLIIGQLFTFLREENYAHWEMLKPAIEKAVRFVAKAQGSDGTWQDPTWTGVTFPKVEYLIYPYIQEIGPLQAMGVYQKQMERK